MCDCQNLIKSLRYCATTAAEKCETCPRINHKECNLHDFMLEEADAIEELLAAVPHWISVEERFPEFGERVLVSNGGFVCESFLSQSGRWQRGGVDMFFMTPTHWMPLPSAPKEVQDG